MANGNLVVPVMGWTEDAELHKRYVEWKEEVEFKLGSSLSNRANSVKSIYVLRWAAFTKLHSLKQGDMPLSEFIREARRLVELCKYPNNQDRLIRDTIVSGVNSLRTYQNYIDAKDLSLQDCINIC